MELDELKYSNKAVIYKPMPKTRQEIAAMLDRKTDDLLTRLKSETTKVLIYEACRLVAFVSLIYLVCFRSVYSTMLSYLYGIFLAAVAGVNITYAVKLKATNFAAGNTYSYLRSVYSFLNSYEAVYQKLTRIFALATATAFMFALADQYYLHLLPVQVYRDAVNLDKTALNTVAQVLAVVGCALFALFLRYGYQMIRTTRIWKKKLNLQLKRYLAEFEEVGISNDIKPDARVQPKRPAFDTTRSAGYIAWGKKHMPKNRVGLFLFFWFYMVVLMNVVYPIFHLTRMLNYFENRNYLQHFFKDWLEFFITSIVLVPYIIFTFYGARQFNVKRHWLLKAVYWLLAICAGAYLTVCMSTLTS